MSDSEPEPHVPSTSVWEASPISQEWHATWEAFYEYLDVYQKDKHQLFRLRSSTSVTHRNTEISAQVVGGEDPELVPESFKTFWVKLICTHGWRRKSRSTSQRKIFFNKSTKCKADMKAAVAWNKEAQKFMVRATGCKATHNHRVDEAVYDNHPSVRRVDGPVLLAFVDVLQSAGSRPIKPKRIMRFLREKTGQNVTLRDVHNMVAKMREQRRGIDTVEKRRCESSGVESTP
ncbi:ATP-binding cassette (ABC) Superfamily [Phytophthora palmivora]|uniref:ATP-binding cassette (ABC) Superfamily n=1 Tax=Phytophthora palmivora TaxID=4796 RepID=A0A2P4WZE1_9STRA|nr:ATP-binding cassette (ABC) Superfamily [Phytophthora palmivora]